MYLRYFDKFVNDIRLFFAFCALNCMNSHRRLRGGNRYTGSPKIDGNCIRIIFSMKLQYSFYSLCLFEQGSCQLLIYLDKFIMYTYNYLCGQDLFGTLCRATNSNTYRSNTILCVVCKYTQNSLQNILPILRRVFVFEQYL